MDTLKWDTYHRRLWPQFLQLRDQHRDVSGQRSRFRLAILWRELHDRRRLGDEHAAGRLWHSVLRCSVWPVVDPGCGNVSERLNQPQDPRCAGGTRPG
jgi:hypothetical protein